MDNKIQFMIINGDVQYLENSTIDHREWYISLGGNPNDFEQVIRGFIMDNKIVFFKGLNFNYDQQVMNAAIMYSEKIKQAMNNPNLEVYCGITISSYGAKWEPVLKINDNELQKEKKEEQIVNDKAFQNQYGHIDNSSMLEIKNDYNDEKFLKKGSLVTIIIMAISILNSLFFQTIGRAVIVSKFDVFLSILQVILLGLCVYLYKQKNKYVKYVAIATSIVMIFTFNLISIILGIIYLLFTIDQKYFQKIENLIKKINKGKGDNSV